MFVIVEEWTVQVIIFVIKFGTKMTIFTHTDGLKVVHNINWSPFDDTESKKCSTRIY